MTPITQHRAAPTSDDGTAEMQLWIDRLQAGDESARDALVEAACSRLRLLAHDLLNGDRLHRWEQTDDVLQEALIQLHRSLEDIRPDTVRQFLRLAAFHIRRVLANFARRYYGPRGMGTNYASDYALAQTGCGSWGNLPAQQSTPSQIVGYGEQKRRLHQAVGDLPDEEREVTELMWFHGLTQRQAAAIVEVSERTIQRRWLRARLKLFDALEGRPPLLDSRLSFIERQRPARSDGTAVGRSGRGCRRP